MTKTLYTCGCWEDEGAGIAEFCSYHDNLTAAEEFES
jgi:hypothetical protein